MVFWLYWNLCSAQFCDYVHRCLCTISKLSRQLTSNSVPNLGNLQQGPFEMIQQSYSMKQSAEQGVEWHSFFKMGRMGRRQEILKFHKMILKMWKNELFFHKNHCQYHQQVSEQCTKHVLYCCQICVPVILTLKQKGHYIKGCQVLHHQIQDDPFSLYIEGQRTLQFRTHTSQD